MIPNKNFHVKAFMNNRNVRTIKKLQVKNKVTCPINKSSKPVFLQWLRPGENPHSHRCDWIKNL